MSDGSPRIEQGYRIVTLDAIMAVGEQPLTFSCFSGSTWRGVFGGAMRYLTCLAKTHNECRLECASPGVCLYGKVFAPPRRLAARRGQHDPPRPYALRLARPLVSSFPAGARYDLRITLVGEAVDWSEAVVAALRRAVSRGIGPARTKLSLLQAVNSVPKPTLSKLPNRIKLAFLSPTRLKADGGFTSAPSFEEVVRAVLRRAISLDTLYGFAHCWDVPALLDQASGVKTECVETRWWDSFRLSKRTGQVMPLGGFIGSVTYEGNLEPFGELLWLGSLLNIGKHATFGMGSVEVSS